MQTKAKSNSVVTHRLDGTAGTELIFTVKGAAQSDDGALLDVELRFSPERASTECRTRAELHGWIQRISDAAAISRDTKTGKSATAAEKLAAMAKLVEHYETGTADWKMAGSGGGGGAGSAEKALLVRCLMEIYPLKTEDEMKEWVSKRSAQERAGLLASERIKAIADRITAEAVKTVDVDVMFAELDDDGAESGATAGALESEETEDDQT